MCSNIIEFPGNSTRVRRLPGYLIRACELAREASVGRRAGDRSLEHLLLLLVEQGRLTVDEWAVMTKFGDPAG